MGTELRYDEAVLAAIESTGRFDANEAVFFARQLEYVKNKTYDIKRVPLNALALMPVSTSIPEGAETITYRQYDTVGMAKVIANYANDLPRADVKGKEFTSPIRSIGNAYGYNVQEIRAAMYARTNLREKKAMAATRAHMETVNKLAFFGDSDSGLPGLFDNANIPTYTILADGGTSSDSKKFSDKSSDKIVRDITNFINSVEITTKGVHRVNELWLPISQYLQIATTKNSDSSDITILEFLQKAHPGVTFKRVVECTGAGTSDADVMIAMENSIENWQLEIPMMLRQHPPQQKGLEFEIPVESRYAGLIIEYPLAFVKAEGI